MQKLKTFIIAFLIFPLICLSQNSKTIKAEIATLFAKADKKNLQNVLPFEIGDKTGLIDASTKKTILEPTKNLQITNLFSPIMTGRYKDYEFEINPKNFQIKIIKPEQPNNDLVPQIRDISGESSKRNGPEVVYENGFKGFAVNGDGELLRYSNIYVSLYQIPQVTPFKYKGNYYAIAAKKTENNVTKYGIIDTNGNTVPHFDFIYDKIYINSLATNENDTWFIVNADTNNSCEKLLEQSAYMNMNGEVRLKGELADYPATGDYFGLDANMSGCIKFSGVLDVAKMEWIIKPQTKIMIRWLDYTSKEKLDNSKIENRNKAKMYVKVLGNNSIYYMDLDLKNKYIPVKK